MMWVLMPRRAMWHYYDDSHPGLGLCGVTVSNPGEAREQPDRPVGFDGLLCNRCWFRHELETTLAGTSDSSTREWLENLDYSGLSDFDTDRLCAVLGENRALSLIVIHGLAESSEAEKATQPVSVPSREVPLAEESNLAVIPLIYRQAPEPEEPEPDEGETDDSAADPAEPRMKINCTRFNSTTNGSNGISRFFKRPGRNRT